jgi:hypothetical protein
MHHPPHPHATALYALSAVIAAFAIAKYIWFFIRAAVHKDVAVLEREHEEQRHRRGPF